jgi:hypothetical protein
MDITVVFSVALANGGQPSHAKPPTLRRTLPLPDAAPIPVTRQGPNFQARVSLGGGGTFALKLSGQDYFDADINFSILPLYPGFPPTVALAHDLVRRVSTGMEQGTHVITLEIMAPQLREVAGPGGRFDRLQTVYQVENDPFGAFPPPPKTATGKAPKPTPDSDDFLRPVATTIEQPRLRFFEHRNGHPLIATYAPRRALPTTGDYVVFFKPPKHNDATPKVVVENYLTRSDWGGLLAAVEHARSTAVLCFLIGEAGRPSATLTSADGIAGLVQEIDAWLRLGNPLLVGRGVRSVALAGFSQGGEYLANAMKKVTTSRLSGLLKAVFIFDCYFPSGQENFKKDLRTWFGSANDLVVRSYWGYTVHRCDLYDGKDLPATAADDGTASKMLNAGHPAGVPAYTWVHLTDSFLKHHCKSLKTRVDLHHSIPRLFMSHALQTAGMARSLW